jgi:hypothetical protein
MPAEEGVARRRGDIRIFGIVVVVMEEENKGGDGDDDDDLMPRLDPRKQNGQPCEL